MFVLTSLMALLQVLVCELLSGAECSMEGAGATVLVTVQRVYYPLLCVVGIPGLYLLLVPGTSDSITLNQSL